MPEPVEQRQEARSRVKVLILEDSKAQAERLKEILAGNGYSVVVAGDGIDGLYALAEARPSLVISDVSMPRLDGYGFCRTVKDEGSFADVPIILLTSLSEPKNVAKGLNAGADYYLTKPYDPAFLLSMVDTIVSDGRCPADRSGRLFMQSAGAMEEISAQPQRIVNFLFSTYENLLSNNRELARTRRELKSANDRLEERIREKTRSLEREVFERRRANEALKRTLDETVVALARAVELRDPYTAGHQMRVSELAFEVGRVLGLDADRLEGIRVMGLLHDIGKITIPAEILAKPSRLSEHEILFIREHSKAGYDILKEIEFPWPVATAVYQHHERLDGSGYPLGLTDRDIVMEAKILAVADVAESMSSHRPYRPAHGIDAALEELARNKSVLYDAGAAEALASILRRSDK